MFILCNLLLLLFISQIIYHIKNKEFVELLYFIEIIVALCLVNILVLNTKKIKIDSKKIIFIYGLIPFVKLKKIKIDNIKYISINYIQKEFHIFFPGKIIYCLDFIDDNQFSYTVFQSPVYNEDLVNLANKLGRIINKEIDDKNEMEGYGNVYKKKII
jgi:hypothetical protein